MNMQEIFDKVVTHAAKGEKSTLTLETGESGQCQYMSSTGRQCFIGCLLPSVMGLKAVEGRSATHPQIIEKLIIADVIDAKYYNPKPNAGLHDVPKEVKSTPLTNMLDRLQRVHDIESVSAWERKLEVVAADYKLDTTHLNNTVFLQPNAN